MKDWANVAEPGSQRGRVSLKERVGLAKGDSIPTRQRRSVKSIQDFAGSASSQAADADLSEREDEDIYAHYIRQMKQAKSE